MTIDSGSFGSGNATRPTVADDYRARGWWEGRRLDALFAETIARVPQAQAVVDGEGAWTYREYADAVAALAHGLLRLGIGRGDRVAGQWPNRKEYCALYFACQRIGAVFVPIIPIFRSTEVGYFLEHSGASVYVAPAEYRGFSYAEMIAELRPTLPELRAVVLAADGGLPEWAVSFGELLSAPAPLLDGEPGDADDLETIVYTSGTESLPKGVMHSHNTRLAGLRAFEAVWGIRDDDVLWVASPISHSTGLMFGVQLPAIHGLTVVIQDGFDPSVAVELLARHRVTLTLGAAPFLQGVLNAPNLDQHQGGLALRIIGCGGAPVPRELAREAKERLGAEILGVYGSTEVGAHVMSYPDETDQHPVWLTDGRTIPRGETRILDQDGKPVGPGVEGEIAMRGPNVSVGYFRSSELNERYFTSDGFVLQGDLGALDADGYLSVTGRKKDVIIRGGLNISAREVEEHLFAHPAVAQVAVVAMPDERLGEKACAYVVPAGDPPSLEEVCRFLLDRGLAKQKLPERLEVVESLPMTAAGKVQKFALRDDIRKRLGDA